MEKIPQGRGPSWIMEQGAQYEGLMVWFNSLTSAGGSVVDPDDASHRRSMTRPSTAPPPSRPCGSSRRWPPPGHDPSITNADDGRRARNGKQQSRLPVINWPFVFASMRSNAAAGDVPFFKEMTRYADLLNSNPQNNQLGEVNNFVRTRFDFAPIRASSRGAGQEHHRRPGTSVSRVRPSRRRWPSRPQNVSTTPAVQKIYAIDGGNPSSPRLRRPGFRAAYPMGDIIGQQLVADRAATRPPSPVTNRFPLLATAVAGGCLGPGVDGQMELADQVKAIDGKG